MDQQVVAGPRQHLRERDPLRRRYPTEPQDLASDPCRRRAHRRRDRPRARRGDRRSAARRSRTIATSAASPARFSTPSACYERAGESCRRCGGVDPPPRHRRPKLVLLPAVSALSAKGERSMTKRTTSILLVMAALSATALGLRRKAEEIARLFQEASGQESRGEWSLASSNYAEDHRQGADEPARALSSRALPGAGRHERLRHQELQRGHPSRPQSPGGARRPRRRLRHARPAGAADRQEERSAHRLRGGAEGQSQVRQRRPRARRRAREPGQSERALEVYGKVAAASPDDATSHAKLGAVLRGARHERPRA